MVDLSTEITLIINNDEPNELEDITNNLRDELLALDIDSVEQTLSTSSPDGTKATGAFDLGALLLKLNPAGKVLATVVSTIQNWLGRQEQSTISLEIGGDKLTLTGLSIENQNQLVATWIQKHSGNAAT